MHIRHATLCLAISVLASQATALDIKGLEVDKPVDCEQINALEIRSGKFAQSCENGMDSWYKEISFLSGKASMQLSQSPERTLLSVLLSNFNFNEALDALTLKWGTPHIEKSIIQNRAGASFDQVEATWLDGKKRLILTKHGSRIDKPSLILIGEEAIKAQQKKTIDNAVRNQGNI